jgi:hypothetical protein
MKNEASKAMEIALLADLADRFDRQEGDYLARFEREKGKAAVQKYRDAQRLARESADPAIREAIREIASYSLMLKQLTNEQLLRVTREASHLDRELALRELTFNRHVAAQRIIEIGGHEQGN